MCRVRCFPRDTQEGIVTLGNAVQGTLAQEPPHSFSTFPEKLPLLQAKDTVKVRIRTWRLDPCSPHSFVYG